MAHYLLTKSFSERSYFEKFISEYQAVKKGVDDFQDELATTDQKKQFLDKLLTKVQDDIENLGS